MFGSNVAGEGVWRNFVDDDYMVQVGIDHNYGSSSDAWVRRADRNNGYRVRLEGYSGTKWVYLDKLVDGEMTLINGASYTVGDPIAVKIKLSGSSIKVWVDGTLKIDETDGDIASGPVSLHGYWTRYSNLKIGYDNNADNDIDDAGDDLVISEDFSGTSVTVSHDDAGNLVVDGHFRYVYDAWNRLVKVQSSLDADVVFQTAEYDGTGRRIRKVVAKSGGLDGTELYLYEQGWRIMEVRDGSGNVTKQFVHGTQYVDELVMMRVKDRGDLYVHQDANWTVIALTDLGGSVVERYVYSPYGEVVVHQETSFGDRDGDGDVDSTDKGTPGSTCAGTVTSSCRILDLDFDGDYDSSDATLFDSLPQGLSTHPGRPSTGVDQPFAHQGLLADAEIGSYQNRHRHYNVARLRFAQRDKFSFQQGRFSIEAHYADGQSLYSYMWSDPLNMLDPSGFIGIGPGVDLVWDFVNALPIAIVEIIEGGIPGLVNYGRYCGPDIGCAGRLRPPYGNGECHIGPPAWTAFSRPDGGGYRYVARCPPPVDGLDKCCLGHDRCYASRSTAPNTPYPCRESDAFPTNPFPHDSLGQSAPCEQQICSCMRKLKIRPGSGAWHQRNQMRIVFLCQWYEN